MRYLKQRSIVTGSVYLACVPDRWVLLDDRDGEREQELTENEFSEQIAGAEMVGIVLLDGYRCQMYKLGAE